MEKKNKIIIISAILVAVLVAVAVTVTLVLVLKKKDSPPPTTPAAPTLDDIISDNSTFPEGSYSIPVDSLVSQGQAPLPLNISLLNSMGLRMDNSSFVAETNRLSYFYVRLPPDNSTQNGRVKRDVWSENGSIGIRFGDSKTINVVPLNLTTVGNSGVSYMGSLWDDSRVFQVEVRMSGEMCSSSAYGSCSMVQWTPYSISSETTGAEAQFNNDLPVACGSQCNSDPNSPCATSCSTCDGQQVAGADTPVTRRYKMGTMAAKNILFSYETYNIKDRITVTYEGDHIFDSDCVGTNGEQQTPLSFQGNSVELRVDVEPNCEGTTSTAWYFTLPCVGCEGCQEYQCLDDSKAHCGPKGYLIGYGLYYCNRYMDYYASFTPAGQKFIDCVKVGLLNYMENYLAGVTGQVNCDDLYQKAFDSHYDVYNGCGFCDVVCDNKAAFTEVLYTSAFNLDAWNQGIAMAKKCDKNVIDCLFT